MSRRQNRNDHAIGDYVTKFPQTSGHDPQAIQSLTPASWQIGRCRNHYETVRKPYDYYEVEHPYERWVGEIKEFAILEEVVDCLRSTRYGGNGEAVRIRYEWFTGAWFCSGGGEAMIREMGGRRQGSSQTGETYYDIDETLYILRCSEDHYRVIVHLKVMRWGTEY